MVVFYYFPHYRGGYYLKPVGYDTRTNDHRNLFPSPLTIAPSLLGRSVRAVMRFHGLKRDFLSASQMGSDTSLRESEENRLVRKWESPSPHPSISVAIYHTRRIDANMHKPQVCTLPINSIMGRDEAEPLKTLVFQWFSQILVKILHSKLIQNVKHTRKATKRFNGESLSARSVQRASDSITNHCYETAIVNPNRSIVNLSSKNALHQPTKAPQQQTIRKTSDKIQDTDV